jgi:uncharacterized coiled-coil DUF342 family protein
MSELSSHIGRIKNKLQELVKNHQDLRAENHRLKEEITSLKEKESGQHETLESLRQQVNVLKLNAGELSAPDKKEIEKKLNHYIREIDRCIAMLSA